MIFRGDHSQVTVRLSGGMQLSLMARGIPDGLGGAVKVFIALEAIQPLSPA